MTSAAATTVLSTLTSLLSQFDSSTSPSTLTSISQQCTLLKQYGKELEQTEKEKLDLVQGELTKMCQDTSLDLQLRLQLLELIELRTLGWESNENMETFYREKFQEVEEKEDEEVKTREQQGGEATGNHPSLDETGHTQEMIQVGAVKLFLSSTNKEVTTAAKHQLQHFFSASYGQNASSGSASNTQTNNTMSSLGNSTMYTQAGTTMYSQANTTFTSPPIPSPTHQYSREMLLTLATSQQAMKAPVNWARRIQSLPSVIIKQQQR